MLKDRRIARARQTIRRKTKKRRQAIVASRVPVRISASAHNDCTSGRLAPNPLSVHQRLTTLRTTASEIYKQSSLAAKATSCSQYVEPPKWEKIKSALESFVDAFFSILREEVKGACSEKILLYEYSELLIKSEKLRKTACEIPKQKNEDYIRKIG